jgi:hypothetical protein
VRVLIKENIVPIRIMYDIIVLRTDDYKWIETLENALSPEDIDLSNYEVRRICVDLDVVTIYVLSKENTNGQDRHNPDPT